MTWTISLKSFTTPLFIENKGQWDSHILFQTEIDNIAIFLEKDGYRILEFDPDNWNKLMRHTHEADASFEPERRLKYHVTKVTFSGVNPDFQLIKSGQSKFHHNYFLDNQAQNHVSNVYSYQKITYKNFYPGIDLEFIWKDRNLKYNFILHAQADPGNIKWRYDGIPKVELAARHIGLRTSIGQHKETMPEVYSLQGGVKKEHDCAFRYDGGYFGYSLQMDGDFETLTIDPELIFSTYAGNTADNFGFTATYDSEGNLYAGGICTGPTKFFKGRYPATPGAFDEEYNGGNDESQGIWSYFFKCDITISKYSADGSQLLYATYLGGVSNEYPHSIIVNSEDELIVFGTTFSPNFPTTETAYQKLRNGLNDLIVSRFSQDGSQLLASTYYGGTDNDGLNQASILKYFYADDFRGEVQVDTLGNIYIGTCTYSTDLRLNNALIQPAKAGNSDGLVLKFDPSLTNLIWGTYLGGNSDDAIYNIDLHPSGTIYVSGGTKSTNLPTSSTSIQPNNKGGTCDGFLAAIDADGRKINQLTYFGTDKYDQIFGIEFDHENQVYIVGQTHGQIPIVGPVYYVKNAGQFIAKMNPELTKLEWSTTWGTGDGAPDLTINAFLVDECRKIFVSGWGGLSSTKSFSSTSGLPITSDAVQKTTDGSDFYLLVLSKNAKKLVYGTYFGGYRTHDHVDGGTSRFDKKGVIYQSVCASCPDNDIESRISDFPTTDGAFAETNSSPRCSNAAFKIAFGNLNAPPEPRDTFLTVTALDTLNFDYVVKDPDDDSIFVQYQPESIAYKKFPGLQSDQKALAELISNFPFSGDCSDISKDTLKIRVYVKDKGCPDYKDSFAYIYIKVLPPPPIAPPATICLNFKSDHLKLLWDATPKSKYFDYLLLHRRDPNGITNIIDTIRHQNGFEFEDFDVVNPKFRDYTYYIVAQNKCGIKGDTSIKASSSKEYELPIEVSYLVTTSVVENKNLEVHWTASTEEDFGSYDIYKKVNDESTNFEYVKTLAGRYDTTFIDTDVNVSQTSYCYGIVVNDNCGHISKMSNVGCSVVLTGEEKPFYFNLYWTPYTDWKGGVQEYMLERSVDTGVLRPIVMLPDENYFFKDDQLDYDWGGYNYRVRASEGPGSYNAVSYSNQIYLIQPPLLHVPNAFTPNGDMLNEKWGIVPVFVKEYHLRIYNRWGEKLFETRDKHEIWNGEYKELLTSNNVYMYMITFTGWDRSVHYRKGTVTSLK